MCWEYKQWTGKESKKVQGLYNLRLIAVADYEHGTGV